MIYMFREWEPVRFKMGGEGGKRVLHEICIEELDNNATKISSSCFLESNDFCGLAETFSAEHEVVFADETHLAGAATALTAVLSVFSRVSSPEKVGHLCG